MKRKVKDSLVRTAMKHKWLKGPCFILLTIFLFGYHLCATIGHNSKKLVCTALLLCFFAVSSSFAFENMEDVTVQTETAMQKPDELTDSEQEVSSQEKELIDETELLDDKDVMEGYENSEFEYVNDNERFDASDILDANEELYDQAKTEKEDSEGATLSKDDWNLVLINKQHSIPEEYEFTLGTITGTGGMKCDERIIPYLLEMLQAAKNDGVNLVICSPYRDINRQKVLFNRKITAYMKKGMSYMDAYRITAQAVTVPGASEHQIGLALDITCDTYSYLNEGFGDTDAGEWLATHSWEYGFILRYPRGKEYITGIEYEPWHFRYVGKDAAEIITEKGITLEEFVDTLSN